MFKSLKEQEQFKVTLLHSHIPSQYLPLRDIFDGNQGPFMSMRIRDLSVYATYVTTYDLL